MYQNSEIKFGKNGNSFPVITDQKAEINFWKQTKPMFTMIVPQILTSVVH